MQYVCSDIHGMYDRYIKAIQRIGENDTLHILGDVIDRGPDGIRILKDMMTRQNVELYIGNHELMMLDALTERKKGGDTPNAAMWVSDANGGGKTAIDLISMPEEKQSAIERYLRHSLIQNRIIVDGKDYLLCHSYFLQDEGVKTVKYSFQKHGLGRPKHDDLFNAVWYSPFRDDMHVPLGMYTQYSDITFIIGHVPVQTESEVTVYGTGNVINVDCGCAYGHVLAESGAEVTSLALLCLDLLRAAPEECVTYIE